ncbi:MAG: succinate dehydrogenase cytochrome b subunit [Candidatus Eremiobacterota bacterium]
MGKKLVQGFTGLVLVGFVIVHLIGNFTLLFGQQAFNDYAHFLEELGHGMVVPVADCVLLLVVLSHVVTGIRVAWLDKNAARPSRYLRSGNAGGPSRKSLSSQWMIGSGLLLLVFLVVHLLNFKYAVAGVGKGPIDEIWVGDPRVDAYRVRDLYTLVVKTFHDPLWLAFYEICMVMLGMHLWHGIWSAFQSLGLTHPRWMPALTWLGWGAAAALAVGYLFLPIYVYTIPLPPGGPTP